MVCYFSHLPFLQCLFNLGRNSFCRTFTLDSEFQRDETEDLLTLTKEALERDMFKHAHHHKEGNIRKKARAQFELPQSFLFGSYLM